MISETNLEKELKLIRQRLEAIEEALVSHIQSEYEMNSEVEKEIGLL